MKRTIIFAFLTIVFLSGCNIQPKFNNHNQTDLVKIQNIINFNLLKSTDLDKYIKKTNDDYTVLEMIIDYNLKNFIEEEISVFSEKNGKVINNINLKKKIFLLSYNL